MTNLSDSVKAGIMTNNIFSPPSVSALRPFRAERSQDVAYRHGGMAGASYTNERHVILLT